MGCISFVIWVSYSRNGLSRSIMGSKLRPFINKHRVEPAMLPKHRSNVKDRQAVAFMLASFHLVTGILGYLHVLPPLSRNENCNICPTLIGFLKAETTNRPKISTSVIACLH